jgi:hypothetical protein
LLFVHALAYTLLACLDSLASSDPFERGGGERARGVGEIVRGEVGREDREDEEGEDDRFISHRPHRSSSSSYRKYTKISILIGGQFWPPGSLFLPVNMNTKSQNRD